MITETSRYYSGTLTRLPDTTGDYQNAVLRTITPGAFTVTNYIWQTGDRLDLLANKFLGDPTQWWVILDVNPEVLNPLTIPPGTPIRLPGGVSNSYGQGTLLQ